MKIERRPNHYPVAIARIFLLLVVSTGCGCAGSGNKNNTAVYRYSPPTATNDGWPVASLQSKGIDPAAFEATIADINGAHDSNKIHGVVVAIDGDLAFETYFPGHEYAWRDFDRVPVIFDRDTLHRGNSVTKSVVSTLVGIAIDKGFIKNTDQTLHELFSDANIDWSDGYRSYKKSSVTLRQTLSMTAGFKWDEFLEPYTSMNNDAIAMSFSTDRIRFVLDRPLVQKPGAAFNYSGGQTTLLASAVERASGMRTENFAKTYLFDPLGIGTTRWDRYANGVDAAGGLYLRPRDMLKLGQLFLNKGVWNGKRIVSESWVAEATRDAVTAYASPQWYGYGYQWWLTEFKSARGTYDVIQAMGWGGQRIIVVDRLHAVVVVTAGQYDAPGPLDEYVFQGLLAAIAQRGPAR